MYLQFMTMMSIVETTFEIQTGPFLKVNFTFEVHSDHV